MESTALSLWRSMPDEFVGPLEKVLHVRRVSVTAVVLAPCELAVQQSVVHGRHLRGAVIAFDIQPLGAEQREHAARIQVAIKLPSWSSQRASPFSGIP
jgi:hypothetical protein